MNNFDVQLLLPVLEKLQSSYQKTKEAPPLFGGWFVLSMDGFRQVISTNCRSQPIFGESKFSVNVYPLKI